MNSYCQVVPWYNSEEWQKVCEDIADSSSNKEYALKTLLVWKARCPSLPSGIESTLSLLHVHVEDNRLDRDAADNQLIRLAYSSAIMRFVNHMLDTETVKGNSLYMAAKNLGVPDWIIDLRHDTAHSNNLPNIALLREACAISLLWLQQNYWDKCKLNVQDFITGRKGAFYGDENKIIVLMDLCTAISICAHPNCKTKNLSEIPDMDMRESIINYVKYLFEDNVDLSNLKTVSISSLINIINKLNQDVLNVQDMATRINDTLLGEDALFLSKELVYFFSANDFKHKSRLNSNYMQCFEVLLTFLHTNDFILPFVMALIKITQDSDAPYIKARLAAMWVSEILAALKRSQEFSLKLKGMDAEGKHPKKRKDLKQLYHHWFPRTRGKNIILDLRKPVPNQLLNINYIQPIVATYNPYLIYFVKNMLNLIEPPLPTEIEERMLKLVELISSPEKFSSTPSNVVYTADDIKLDDNSDNDVEIVDVITEKEDFIIEQQENVADNQMMVKSIWKLASKNENWSSCPIGQLPWQQNAAMEI